MHVPRDVRRPTAAAAAGAGAGAGAAAAEKSLAAPSHSGIIAHSFARTHDTCTKTKPKSISRLGSHALSPPQPPTYKTTLRAIRRLWGVGGSTFRSIGPQSDRTSNSHCDHIESASRIDFTSTSHPQHTDVASVSQEHHAFITTIQHHNDIISISHQYQIGITLVSNRYHIGIKAVSQRHHIGITTHIA